MKIGIVCYPTYGGSGVVATELGISLAHKGHEVHFITYNQPVRLNALSKNIYFHEVFVEEYPLFHYQPYELALSSKIVAMTELYGIEILHVHYAIPHAYAAYMAQKMLMEKNIYLPIVTTLHGTDITLVGSHPNYKTAVEFSINNSNAVTVVSNSLKADTLRLFDIKKDIHVIYNFIDFDKYDSLTQSDCVRGNLAKPDEKIITHISNFRPVKRILDVINIFFRVQEKVKAQLLLVGDGPDRDAANQLVRNLGIRDHVKFLGNSVEINKILCLSDLFLLPSQTESFGLAALEAMAAKTPVISSNAGGLPEVNVNGKTGFLSSVGNVEEMARNAIYILSDEERLVQFKQQAYENAGRFTMDKILPHYEEVYNSVKVTSK